MPGSVIGCGTKCDMDLPAIGGVVITNVMSPSCQLINENLSIMSFTVENNPNGAIISHLIRAVVES